MRRFPLIVLLFAFVLSLAGCLGAPGGGGAGGRNGLGGGLPEAKAVLSGKIVWLKEGSCLLAGTAPSELFMLSSLPGIYDENSEPADPSALKAGQTVELGYSGAIAESYPAQPGKPVYLKITEQGDDLVGFYQTVLFDLWETDPGLNSDIRVLAFDLSKVANLSDAEKSALVYTVSASHDLTGITGTFSELCEQGYIDEEQLYFETGLLFTIETADVTEEGFSFDASKWRSGLGAYFFHDCRAEKKEHGFTYTVGAEMIA